MSDSSNHKSIPGLDKIRFSYGPGMQKKWVENNLAFLTHVAAKYGQSAKASLLASEIIVTEVDEDLIPKFDEEEDERVHLAGLRYLERKLCHSTLEDYAKFSRIIRKDLATVYGVLHGLCDAGLQNRIEAEPDYQAMVKKSRFCAIKLHGLVKKICNGSIVVIVEDVIGNAIEALFNFF